LVLPGQVKTNFRKSAGGKVQEGYNVYWYVKKLIYLVFHSNKEKIVIGVNHKITDFFSRLFSSRISKKFLYKFAKEK
jgi:short-subunit dehydrogenase